MTLLGGTAVPEQMPQAVAPTRSTVPLACRLRPRVGRQGPSPTSGEVELENVLGEPVEIEVDMHPLQYLTLAVTEWLANGPNPAELTVSAPELVGNVVRRSRRHRMQPAAYHGVTVIGVNELEPPLA